LKTLKASDIHIKKGHWIKQYNCRVIHSRRTRLVFILLTQNEFTLCDIIDKQRRCKSEVFISYNMNLEIYLGTEFNHPKQTQVYTCTYPEIYESVMFSSIWPKKSQVKRNTIKIHHPPVKRNSSLSKLSFCQSTVLQNFLKSFQIRPTFCDVNEWQLKLYSSIDLFFTEIAMNLYHAVRKKNITVHGKNDKLLSLNVKEELFLYAEGRCPPWLWKFSVGIREPTTLEYYLSGDMSRGMRSVIMVSMTTQAFSCYILMLHFRTKMSISLLPWEQQHWRFDSCCTKHDTPQQWFVLFTQHRHITCITMNEKMNTNLRCDNLQKEFPEKSEKHF
jgi:hypothetical protein